MQVLHEVDHDLSKLYMAQQFPDYFSVKVKCVIADEGEIERFEDLLVVVLRQHALER